MSITHRRSSQRLQSEHLLKQDNDHYYQLYLDQLSGNRDPFVVGKVTDMQIRQISIQLFSLWHKVMDAFAKDSKVLSYHMRHKYLEHQRKLLNELVITSNDVGGVKG